MKINNYINSSPLRKNGIPFHIAWGHTNYNYWVFTKTHHSTSSPLTFTRPRPPGNGHQRTAPRLRLASTFHRIGKVRGRELVEVKLLGGTETDSSGPVPTGGGSKGEMCRRCEVKMYRCTVLYGVGMGVGMLFLLEVCTTTSKGCQRLVSNDSMRRKISVVTESTPSNCMQSPRSSYFSPTVLPLGSSAAVVDKLTSLCLLGFFGANGFRLRLRKDSLEDSPNCSLHLSPAILWGKWLLLQKRLFGGFPHLYIYCIYTSTLLKEINRLFCCCGLFWGLFSGSI